MHRAAAVYLTLALLFAAPLSLQAAPGAPPAVVESLREQLDVLTATGGLELDGQPLVAVRSLPSLYAANGFAPFWNAARLQVLLGLIRASDNDGLLPADYPLAALTRRAAGGAWSPIDQARLDLLATDAYALLLYHGYFGKVDPRSLDPNWNYELREIGERDPIALLVETLRAGDLKATLAAVRPANALYGWARESLADPRRIAARGGWPTVPAGPTLRTGDEDPRVQALRARLVVTGELSADAANGESFDSMLESAVWSFQARHNLTADGIVGRTTLAALNVPVEARIDQIRLNLERGRWVLNQIGDGDQVIVDVAGFEVRVASNGRTLWRSRAVIGKPYRQTPIFRASIDHVVLNPTWTVPPTILAKDVLPAIRRNRGYLAQHRMSVIDRNGRVVDPTTIDFSRYTGRNFPWMIRQDPGPQNSLGLVKIMFPNPHLVYLHDTPAKSLFREDARSFSSGCIRVEQPFDLVERLLATTPGWDRASIDAAVATGKTRTVRLAKPIPVLLLYWTIDRGENGETLFKADPYDRDPTLLAALDRPFAAGSRLRP